MKSCNHPNATTIRMFVALSLLLAAMFTPSVVNAQSMNLKVMTLNVWSQDSQTAALKSIIEAGGADIVGLQEMDGAINGQALATSLGWHYHAQAQGDLKILSRYAIIGQSSDNRGAQIEIAPGHNVWLFNAHLAAYPYQPYDLRDNPSLTEQQLVNAAETTRGAQVDAYINSIAATTSASDPVFFTGDFNEPSHLDWTAAAAVATGRSFDKKVAWPASVKIAGAGFSDSFRAVRPDEVNDRGYTWTPKPGANEVHDRIDFVYSRGPQVTAISSQTVGEVLSNPNTDIAVAGYVSDHRAVVSGFTVDDLAGTTLTFSRLGTNTDLAATNYGDNTVGAANVTVAYTATGGAHWDTYDSGVNWDTGVAQLDGSGTFDLTLTPEAGWGVRLDSFDLADYENFAAGHTVGWELLDGLGTVLASGTEIIAPNAINTVMTGYNQAISGDAVLRLNHLSGDTTDLALDNVKFSQVDLTGVPEPSCGLLVLVALTGIGMRRNRRPER